VELRKISSKLRCCRGRPLQILAYIAEPRDLEELHRTIERQGWIGDSGSCTVEAVVHRSITPSSKARAQSPDQLTLAPMCAGCVLDNVRPLERLYRRRAP
jgi:hypothetical protein